MSLSHINYKHNRIFKCPWNFIDGGHKHNKVLERDARKKTLHKIPKFHLISWCGNFKERHSFRVVSGDSPETMRKLYLSQKFPHQKIRENFGILSSGSLQYVVLNLRLIS